MRDFAGLYCYPELARDLGDGKQAAHRLQSVAIDLDYHRMLTAGFFERCDDVSDFGAANVFHVKNFEPVLRCHYISHQNVPAPAAALGDHLKRFFAEDLGYVAREMRKPWGYDAV